MARQINIDYRELTGASEFKTKLDKEIDNAIYNLENENEETTISVTNISSALFCDLYDVEPDEFNGWQCDWWGGFERSGEHIRIFGEAWYGRVELNIEL